MKILLVNNNTQHLKSLSKSLAGHDVEIQRYRPGLVFNDKDKDLIILSGGGGEGLEIHDKVSRGKLWYEDQMNFILTTDKPIIGICMGFEVIASAYGAEIDRMQGLLQGKLASQTTVTGQKLLNRKKIVQQEAHEWQVTEVNNKELEVLATSETGIEVIRHKKRPIFATQFHPEVPGGSLQLKQLINSPLALTN